MSSVYIHIPFCESICTYCDFCKFYYNEEIVDKYLKSLKQEIKENYKGEIIETIYIGGGTPSVLNLEQLTRLLDITKIFKTNNLEFTFECNVENITEEKILLLHQYKVNRISIGVQTFNSKYLGFLNRHHTEQQVFDVIQMIKKYITNINVDLIYAIPGETLEELETDLDVFLSLDIPHISTYSLIIEEHTILNNKHILPIETDLDYEMYQLIIQKLNKYKHYETSNFGIIPSRHNLTYWNNLEYYGFGLGASGYVNGSRYDNTRNLNKYLSGEYIKESHILSELEKIENEFILGFRKTDGIDVDLFKKKYNKNVTDIKCVGELISSNKLILNNNHLYINPIYSYVANDILINFIDLEEL